MKQKLTIVLTIALIFCFCACSSNTADADNNSNASKSNSSKSNPTSFADFAAKQMVEDAINEWMSTRFLSIECTDFSYNINSIERSNRTFTGDDLQDVTWYNAYGDVIFYDVSGAVLTTGSFDVLYNHNGVNSCGFNPSYTVIELDNLSYGR